LELDHVLIAVSDLGEAARQLQAVHGLLSVEGGRHPGWGTANSIVPLGDTYLELIAVVDEAEAAGSPFGSWVAGATFDRPLGWAVRTRELDAIARRLGLTVDAGVRITPDGAVLRWRTAGKGEAVTEPSLPFFIEWAPGTEHPGMACPANATLATLVLDGDVDRLASWLGDHALPIVVRPGLPAVASIVVSGPGGEIVLGDP